MGSMDILERARFADRLAAVAVIASMLVMVVVFLAAAGAIPDDASTHYVFAIAMAMGVTWTVIAGSELRRRWRAKPSQPEGEA